MAAAAENTCVNTCENTWKQTGNLTEAERQELVQLLSQSYSDFMRSVAAIGEPQWFRKPEAGAWSIIEIVDHLVLVEREVLKTVQTRILDTPQSSPDAAEARLKDAAIAERLISREEKRQAPEAFRPSGQFESGEQARDAFRAARGATIAYAQRTQDPLRSHRIPHRVFGPLDGYQWLLILGTHTARHVKQIEEVKVAGGA